MTGLTITMRVVHLAASLLLVGGLAFVLLVARPVYRAKQPEHPDGLDHIDRVVLRGVRWGLFAMLVSGVFGLWTQLATVTGHSPLQALTVDNLWSLLTRTQYGWVWTIRMVLMALLSGLLWLRDAGKAAREQWAWHLAGTALAVGLLVTQAWVGHAATGEGWTLVSQVLADGLHLLASGIWLGGLPLYMYLLSWALRGEDASATAMATEATWRFSVLALVSVSVLIITGLLNAWKLVGTAPALVGTTYGRFLLLKVALFLLMLALAALNLFRERPRLAHAIRQQRHREARQSLQRLRRNVSGELVLGGSVLLIVGVLGLLPPAYHDQPTWPFAFRLNWEATKDAPGVRTSMTIGIAIAASGCAVALLATISRMRYWLGIAIAGLIAVGVGCMVWLPKLAIDTYPTTYLRPTTPYNALSIATGLRLYSEHCAICHGTWGYGDGPATPGRRPPLADLTAPHTANHTAGDLFWWLTHGKPGTAMPGFAAQLSTEDRWDLINFARALSAAKQARLLSPQVGTNLWRVAPDFAYTTRLQDVRTLAEHRGREPVLLVFFTTPGSLSRLAQLRDCYPQVRERGVEMLGIPLQDVETSEKMLIPLKIPFPVVTDGAPEAAVAYTLFRRSVASEDSQSDPEAPPHVEFLIDRAGYLRARWIPQEGKGWAITGHLLSTIEQLSQEKPGVPIPDLHVH